MSTAQLLKERRNSVALMGKYCVYGMLHRHKGVKEESHVSTHIS